MNRRFQLFSQLIKPFSEKSRKRRMKIFAEVMALSPGTRILDLGGQPGAWRNVVVPLDLTILNLPGVAEASVELPQHRVRYVEGDACNVVQFDRGDFDILHSNSVIEHLGPEENQEAFASEVKRLSRRYWVQTSSEWFPIEPHCGMPFWWFYPEPARQWFIRRWSQQVPRWAEMIAGTRLVTKKRLQSLFPETSSYVEWSYGFPKSYVVYQS
ncbi:MAG TPA: class I SAM-dependent methyltransferase [Polyangiales bacterium]|nr:class I SAM-dependent methyltransferase [Polyangiales bacterium]